MSESGTPGGFDPDRVAEKLHLDRAVRSLDPDRLLEGTALEAMDTEGEALLEEGCRLVGESVGRRLGEGLGGYLGAVIALNLLEDADVEAVAEGSDDGNRDGGDDNDE